jgi:hypothetical protein
MSLEYGGLFDCGDRTRVQPVEPNSWQPPHSNHRWGINADIDLRHLNSDNTCIQVNRARIEQICRDRGIQPFEELDHYHITIQ